MKIVPTMGVVHAKKRAAIPHKVAESRPLGTRWDIPPVRLLRQES
jgi:hypothetical protein